MELKKLEDNGKRLIIEFDDETVAFVNMIKDKLWEDPSVKEAATIREHPYLSKPKILVEVSRGHPKAALEKVTEKLIADAKEFREKFKSSK